MWDLHCPERQYHREEGEEVAGLAGVWRRKSRGEAAESEEGNATLDLLSKHLDVTLATYV
jgi:hypothetical protein